MTTPTPPFADNVPPSPTGSAYAQPYAPVPHPAPYGHQPAQPNPYASGGYGRQAAPAPAPAHGTAGQHVCRICGAFPAVDATVRRHQGMLLMMRFVHLKGPFCRTCGTAVFRDMTTKTLWQGWWSPFSLVAINPITIIINLIARSRINKLPQPVPGQPGAQLNPGKPMTSRPAVLVVLLPLAWWIGLIVQIIRHS
ncbi:hypothetical protein [Streptantibioticus ferralitis]|uniref:Uncharacterized protein n=1 Tax=Streptantibioticus ferralitis TaxID=236510 RepID=A0ABT5YU99_9ACTN|nr:hypothetical protein [Streptantibioticus ferralitis]MDF2255188.1 hypothetical protein [Streptantibioticus ferralitis]